MSLTPTREYDSPGDKGHGFRETTESSHDYRSELDGFHCFHLVSNIRNVPGPYVGRCTNRSSTWTKFLAQRVIQLRESESTASLSPGRGRGYDEDGDPRE